MQPIDPPVETLLDVAMEVFTIYIDLLTDLIKTHGQSIHCWSYNSSTNTECRTCDLKYGDDYFGQKVRLLGSKVHQDPLLQNLPEPETGFDPDDLYSLTTVCPECSVVMLHSNESLICENCNSSEKLKITPVNPKDFRPKISIPSPSEPITPMPL